MRRMIHLVLFGVLCAAVLGAHPAAAQLDPVKLIAARTAAGTFAVMARESVTSGQVPRADDPAVKMLLDAVFDASDVMALKAPLTFAQTSALDERAELARRVRIIYMLAGTGSPDLSTPERIKATEGRARANTIRYAPEIGRAMDFQTRLEGATMDAIVAELASAPPERLHRTGFHEFAGSLRRSMTRIYVNQIEILKAEGLDDPWRRARIAVLVEVAPKLTTFLAAEQRTELRQAALSGAAALRDEGTREGLRAFAQAL